MLKVRSFYRYIFCCKRGVITTVIGNEHIKEEHNRALWLSRLDNHTRR